MAKEYDVVIVGSGPAGIMAAIRASELGRSVVLLERNDCIGKKLLITGKGRCNITNAAGLDAFIEKFGKQGLFLRSAFSAFFNKDLIDFCESKGLHLKKERQERIFPITDMADSVVTLLRNVLGKNNIKVLYNMRVSHIRKKGDFFQLDIVGKDSISAKQVILATGGTSYGITGSTGDGFNIAKKLGHSIQPLTPALVPLKTQETWVKHLQGLSLKNVRISFVYGKKKIISDIGELLFTHFGVSGPLILDLSGRITALIRERHKIKLFIDLKPGLEHDKLCARLLREFSSKGKMYFKNIMKNFLPQRLIPVFVNLAGIDPLKVVSQIKKHERDTIINLLKALPLNIIGSLGMEHAMVTNGGITTKEINPRTMESKCVPGLYFAGEIIDGCAPSGGYNLQQAFSTGYLAGGTE